MPSYIAQVPYESFEQTASLQRTLTTSQPIVSTWVTPSPFFVSSQQGAPQQEGASSTTVQPIPHTPHNRPTLSCLICTRHSILNSLKPSVPCSGRLARLLLSSGALRKTTTRNLVHNEESSKWAVGGWCS